MDPGAQMRLGAIQEDMFGVGQKGERWPTEEGVCKWKQETDKVRSGKWERARAEKKQTWKLTPNRCPLLLTAGTLSGSGPMPAQPAMLRGHAASLLN